MSFAKVLIFALFALCFVVSEAGSVQLVKVGSPQRLTGWECSTCISFMDQAIDQLINIIANVGVAGGCSAVCGLLPAQWEATVCMLLCEIEGIQEFSNLINDVDPDPIWICMELDVCTTQDNAKGVMKKVSTNPSQGPQGTTFELDMAYQILNQTGTGMIIFEVNPPGSGFPFEFDGLIFDQAPGLYKVSATFQATPQQNEPFTPGVYQVIAAVCEGSCGSIHSHSYTICEGQTTFRITG